MKTLISAIAATVILTVTQACLAACPMGANDLAQTLIQDMIDHQHKYFPSSMGTVDYGTFRGASGRELKDGTLFLMMGSISKGGAFALFSCSPAGEMAFLASGLSALAGDVRIIGR